MDKPGNNRVPVASDLANIDAPVGTRLWVESEAREYVAAPYKTGDGITGPADQTRVLWIKTTTLSLPRYVYGLDAAAMLEQLKSSTGKAMFVLGDSKSSPVTEAAASYWSQIPVRGMTFQISSSLDTTNFSSAGGDVIASPDPSPGIHGPRASTIYSGNINDYTLAGAIEQKVLLATTSARWAPWVNRIHEGATSNTALLARLQGNAITGTHLFRISTTGVTAANIGMQIWTSEVNASWAPPNQGQTALFSTKAATNYLLSKSVTLPNTATLGTGVSMNAFFGDTALVINETFSCTRWPWIEIADGSGTTLHQLCTGGLQVDDYLNNSDRTSGIIYSETVFAEELPLRAGKREPWLLVDLGTNNQALNNESQHYAEMQRLIERVRAAAKRPNMPVLLRTAYPDAGHQTATTYYSLAAIRLANSMRNVMCVDTHAASYDGGGYSAMVSKGWTSESAPEVHRNAAGNAARERMFDAIMSGQPVTYSATVG